MATTHQLINTLFFRISAFSTGSELKSKTHLSHTYDTDMKAFINEIITQSKQKETLKSGIQNLVSSTKVGESAANRPVCPAAALNEKGEGKGEQ